MSPWKPRILIADESAVNRDLTVQTLEPLGASILHADEADTAIAMMKSEPGIDLVVVGTRMTDMDGLHLCRIIQLEPGLGGVPIVMRTDDPTILDYREAFRCGISEVLSTDEDPDFIRMAVGTRLRARVG